METSTAESHTAPMALPPVLSAGTLEASRRRDPALRILDVRTPREYESVHLEGSYNVPLDRLAEHAQEIRGAVEHPVVLVCRSGSRSRQAQETLEASGLRNLHLLEGGLDAWIADGRPVRRGPERISLERQVRIAAGALAAIGGVLALTVNPLWAGLPAAVGAGLVFAGVTDTCGMALLLSRLPYNRTATCDVDRMVRSLCDGTDPTTGRASC